jgi:threonine aldolase
VLSVEYTDEVSVLAHRRGLLVHLDGARIFNAAVALGVPASALTRNVDTVSFCLSKGLSAPVGSVLCGTREFIQRARKVRKMLGGGMRQAGVIAAAGVVALESMIDRLAEDHANARRLAQALRGISGIRLTQAEVPTNIVVFELTDGLPQDRFAAALTEMKVKIGPFGGALFRAVTHRMVSSADVDEAAGRIETICRKLMR